MSVISRLITEIDKEGYDIIHCHGARANFIAMLLRTRIKKIDELRLYIAIISWI